MEKDAPGAGASSRAAGITTRLLWTREGVLARTAALEIFRELSDELADYRFRGEHGCLNLFEASERGEREPYRALLADALKDEPATA